MKTLPLLLLFVLFLHGKLHAESDHITFRFTANHSCSYIQSDSIRVENLTQGGAKTLFYPDTVLTFIITGTRPLVPEHREMVLSQNYPNPFSGQTSFELYMPASDGVTISVYDLTGRVIAVHERYLDQGNHHFLFHACSRQAYLLMVNSNKYVQQRMMIQLGKGGVSSRLEYRGFDISHDYNETMVEKSAGDALAFDPGDALRFTCYVTDLSGDLDQGVITEAPDGSRNYLFDIFARPPRQPSLITGMSSVPHLESGLVYAVDPVPGLTYHWTVPVGWEIIHGQGQHTITVDAGAASGMVRVVAINNCGAGPARTMTVSVAPPEPEPFSVSFQVNLSAAMHSGALQGFDPAKNNVFFTGNMVGWAMPGSNPALEMEKISDDPLVYEMVRQLEAGAHEYKYFSDFIDQGWDGGEWPGEPNRVVIVEGDTTLFDYWGTLEIPDEPDDPDYSALIVGIWKMAPMEGALSVYPSDRSAIYWQNSQQDLINMACFFDDEYWLYEDGTFKNNQGEETWLEPWQNEEQQYRCDTPVPPHDGSAEATWTVSGKIMTIHGRGAYIGFPKVIYNNEIDNPEDAPEEILYPFKIIQANENNVLAKDTMVIEIPIKGGEQFWKFILVKETGDVPDDPDDPDVQCDYGTLTDIDGNSYHTIIIGEQEWMAENLRTTRYHDGTPIATGLTADQWRYTTQGAYTVYPHARIDGIGSQQEMLSMYGALYNWHATVDSRALCPAGWRVPTHYDWVELEQTMCNALGNQNCNESFPYDYTTFLWRGTNEGQALKSCRQVNAIPGGHCSTSEHPRWNQDNIQYGTNEFCFSALPAGAFGWTGDTAVSLGEQARWWTSTEHVADHNSGIIRVLFHDRSEIGRSANPKGNGFSIRCIRGEPISAVLPSVITTNVSEITQTTASGGGQVTSNGGAQVTDRGIVYSKQPNPDLTDHAIPSGEGIGSFVCIMTGLEPATTYYVRAYATNQIGTAYGEQVVFESEPLQPEDPRIGWANLQWPPEGNITVGSPFVVYARVYIEGLTGPGATPGGLANLSVWIGYSKTDASHVSDFNKSDWTWVPASLNDYAAMFGSNSEYYADIGSTIGAPGTYYYVSRFKLGNGEYLYGGYNEGFWDGTSNVSGILNVDAPPSDFECGDALTFTYRNSQVTYGTIMRNGLCWMDRNLGASRVPVTYNDLAGFGDLFQWGRLDDGHQDRSSQTTTVLSQTDIPGHNRFIIFVLDPNVTTYPVDWRNPRNDNLWQGTDGVNNPCPDGWRIPSGVELNNERLSWQSNNTAGAYLSSLKWPTASFRPGMSTGKLNIIGEFGSVWSSGVHDNYSMSMYYAEDDAMVSPGGERISGKSVRCVMGAYQEPVVPEKYTLTLIAVPSDGGTLTGAGQYEAGQHVTITATPAKNHEFVVWKNNLGQEITTQASFSHAMPAHNVVLYAHFKEEEEPVTPKYTLGLMVVPAGTGTVEGAGQYEAGTMVTIGAKPKQGYAFDAWKNTHGQTVSTLATFSHEMPAFNVVLYAHFKEVTDVKDVTNPKTGRTWMDRNLGASRVATSSQDAQAYGNLYQWGRGSDGHQLRTSGKTSTLSNSNTPGHGNFITVINSPYDWRSPQNPNLWQGVSGTNNPCPSGYRLPTSAEINAERMSWVTNDAAGAFASPLKLPMGGVRSHGNGSLFGDGSNGVYWSSTSIDNSSQSLLFFENGVSINSRRRADAASIRCIKD